MKLFLNKKKAIVIIFFICSIIVLVSTVVPANNYIITNNVGIISGNLNNENNDSNRISSLTDPYIMYSFMCDWVYPDMNHTPPKTYFEIDEPVFSYFELEGLTPHSIWYTKWYKNDNLWYTSPDYNMNNPGSTYLVSTYFLDGIDSSGTYYVEAYINDKYIGRGPYFIVGNNDNIPEIAIESIKNGFRVSSYITNTGSEVSYNIPWSICLYGGFIISGDPSSYGIIDELQVGETITIIQKTSLWGIGRTTIIVSAGDALRQASAFILGPLVI